MRFVGSVSDPVDGCDRAYLFGSPRGFPNLIRVTALVCKRMRVAPLAPGSRWRPEGAPKIPDVVMLAIGLGFLRVLRRLRDGLRPALRNVVIFDYSLAGFVSAGLLFYLIYALLRPERF